MKRGLIIFCYALVIAIVWLNRTGLLQWVKTGEAPLPLIVLLVVGLACVPIIPFSAVIGTMGYVYGPLLGALLSLLGAWLAGMIMYGLFRYGFRERGRALLRCYKLTERWTAMVERHPFQSVLLARLMPIVPQTAVNVYAAVAAIPFLHYASASFLGKVPAMLIFAFIGDRISADWQSLLLVAGVYVLFLLLVYGSYRIWQAKAAS
ncbi:TVP38/TMEM64 family protein [Paenibacillus montanisoli]|uniref:TVP38/TMEM64 family membrane protein n=1 Tax=Paenibacillus montanisoli TaxID=2081970 RepID=A0A328U5E2_9BACL|nr:VTT domain-containing protein [Paenibacillus montanisoli]RAP76145.1 TVP38/TMEM64 family protein [Paenibacillus montanisoli]